VWLGLTVGKLQGRSLCIWGVASGSAASHPDPGSSGMVEISEESQERDSSLISTRSKGIGILTRSVSEGCSNCLTVRKRDPR